MQSDGRYAHLPGLLVVLYLLHVDFQRSKQRVVETDVHAHHVKRECVSLVCLKRRRDGEARGRVTVQRVHELLLLDGAHHHRPATRVSRDVLPWHDPTQPRLPERLRVHLLEAALIGGEFEDDNLPRVTSEHDVVAVAARQPAGGDRPDYSKHVGGMDGLHLAAVIGPHQLEHLGARHDDLLLPGAREVTIQRGGDSAALLQRQRVEVHGCDRLLPPRARSELSTNPPTTCGVSRLIQVTILVAPRNR